MSYTCVSSSSSSSSSSSPKRWVAGSTPIGDIFLQFSDFLKASTMNYASTYNDSITKLAEYTQKKTDFGSFIKVMTCAPYVCCNAYIREWLKHGIYPLQSTLGRLCKTEDDVWRTLDVSYHTRSEGSSVQSAADGKEWKREELWQETIEQIWTSLFRTWSKTHGRLMLTTSIWRKPLRRSEQ